MLIYPGTVAALSAHRRAQVETRLPWGANYREDLDLVFCRPDGSPLDPDVVTHQFGKAAQRARVRGIRFHDLRHTHATLLLAANVHPKVVQERLGHSSVLVTLGTYSHVLPTPSVTGPPTEVASLRDHSVTIPPQTERRTPRGRPF